MICSACRLEPARAPRPRSATEPCEATADHVDARSAMALDGPIERGFHGGAAEHRPRQGTSDREQLLGGRLPKARRLIQSTLSLAGLEGRVVWYLDERRRVLARSRNGHRPTDVLALVKGGVRARQVCTRPPRRTTPSIDPGSAGCSWVVYDRAWNELSSVARLRGERGRWPCPKASGSDCVVRTSTRRTYVRCGFLSEGGFVG